MLGDDHWRCVWFDPIAAVFVHDTAGEAVRQHAVDFAARHFRPDASSQSHRLIERIALAKAFRTLLQRAAVTRTELVWPLVWLGLDNCRGILREEPDSAIGWKMLGQIEIAREPAAAYPPSPRYRLPFDPVADLSLVRATYALRRALEREPDDMTTLHRARRGLRPAGHARGGLAGARPIRRGCGPPSGRARDRAAGSRSSRSASSTVASWVRRPRRPGGTWPSSIGW